MKTYINRIERKALRAISCQIKETIKIKKIDIKKLIMKTKINEHDFEKIINGAPYVEFWKYLKVIDFLGLTMLKYDSYIIENYYNFNIPIFDME